MSNTGFIFYRSLPNIIQSHQLLLTFLYSNTFGTYAAQPDTISVIVHPTKYISEDMAMGVYYTKVTSVAIEIHYCVIVDDEMMQDTIVDTVDTEVESTMILRRITRRLEELGIQGRVIPKVTSILKLLN